MGRDFHAAAGIDVPFDAASFASLCERLIGDENALVLIADGGMLAALCFPIYFNANALVVQELFWWVDPAKRGNGIARKMLKEAERWAREKGAVAMHMIALASNESVGEMYERHGYKPLERVYVRSL
jgi:GNAT superfamily N-acetyltransferase